MGPKRGLPRLIGRAAIGLVSLIAMMTPAVRALASGQALVIGEASYHGLPPLPGCALSARAVAAALRGAGFAVDEQIDASNGALYAAIGKLSAAAPTATFIYICSYATSFEDRSFVLPVSADISRPADVLTRGLLAKTLLNAAAGGKPAAAILAIDAVPLPNGPSVLDLDRLMQPALPGTLGYIATITGTPGSTPTPLAATLVELLHARAVESAGLLTGVQQQLGGLNTVSVAALHVPDAGVYLAGAPAVAAAARSGETASPSGSPASLPNEEQMTEAQRRLVQRALAHLGYYDAAADGVFGAETRAAIRRWQHEVHAPMTGHLTAEQASKLASPWD
jgi:hypothetical protein